MTTITASSHQRTPLIAALAAGAALVVGGAIGVAWEQNNSDTSAVTHSNPTTPGSFGGATTSDEYSSSLPETGYPGGAITFDEFSSSLPQTGSPGGATTSDEFSGSTSGSIPATGSPGGATTSQESTR